MTEVNPLEVYAAVIARPDLRRADIGAQFGITGSRVVQLMRQPPRGYEVPAFRARLAQSAMDETALRAILADVTTLWREVRAELRQLTEAQDEARIDLILGLVDDPRPLPRPSRDRLARAITARGQA